MVTPTLEEEEEEEEENLTPTCPSGLHSSTDGDCHKTRPETAEDQASRYPQQQQQRSE